MFAEPGEIIGEEAAGGQEQPGEIIEENNEAAARPLPRFAPSLVCKKMDCGHKVIYGHHYDVSEWERCASLEENQIPADETTICTACDKEIRRKRGKTMFETLHYHHMKDCAKYLYRKS